LDGLPAGRLTTMDDPKHIVAAAALVTDASGRVLMIRGPRRGWEFPGGQVEEGEDIVSGLKREVLEETGIAISVDRLAGVYSNLSSRIVMFDFICEYADGEPRLSSESLAVQRVDRSEAASRVSHPAIRERLLSMLRFDGRVLYRAYTLSRVGETIDYAVESERFV